jgi:hypothetical protein
MPVTITLPDNLARELRARAESRQLPLDELVADILSGAVESSFGGLPTVEEVVAEIKATKPDPGSFHPAADSLAELLAAAPDAPTFTPDKWNRE